MAKIMLVEDDNNLREIYAARLQAEGYEIVAAKDGEEALALAVKEKPELIISDVMMPRISGFDMLDILRNAPETKTTKVIMMTALSQAEDKARADKLGADRYLVKSQVTLEDVARTVKDVLDGKPEHSAPPPATPPPVIVAPPPAPVLPPPAPVPVTPPTPPVPPPAPVPVPPAPPAPAIPEPPNQVQSPAPIVEPPAAVTAAPPASTPAPVPAPPAVPPATETATDSIPVLSLDLPGAEPPLDTPAPDTAPPPAAEVPAVPPVAEVPAPAEAPTAPETGELPTIKVELPTPPDELTASSTPSEAAAASAPPPAATEDASFVGPSLAEALANEEKAAGVLSQNDGQEANTTPEPAAEAAIPNPEPEVSEPTAPEVVESPEPSEPPATPEPEAVPEPPVPAPEPDATPEPADPEQESPEESEPKAEKDPVNEPHPAEQIAGKKIIRPITDDFNKKPDLNALLAAEEQKAAVENPVANTVIKPLPGSPGSTDATVHMPPADDTHNDIAL